MDERRLRSDGTQLLQIPARRRADRDVRALLADPGRWHRPDALAIVLNGCAQEMTAAADCFRELARRPYLLPEVYRQP